MKKSSRIRLLLLCLIISIVSFAFACTGGDSGNSGGNTPSTDVTLDGYEYDERDIAYNTYVHCLRFVYCYRLLGSAV